VLARLDERDPTLAEREAEVAYQEAENAAARGKLAVDEALARIERSRQAAEQADRDYERDRTLFEVKDTASPLSQKALESSLLTRDNARADLRQAEIGHRRAAREAVSAENAAARAKVAWERAALALQYTRIEAPIDGVIAERSIRVGDTVGDSQAAFVLTDPTRLRAVFLRPQEELGLFDQSDDAAPITFTARAESYPDREFLGEIERVSPTIDPTSGQFRVTARIRARTESESSLLLPGMLVRMRIVTDRHPEALVVAKRATEREGDRSYLRVFEAQEGDLGTVRLVDFEEGYSDDQGVEVIPLEPDALRAGQAIVLVGRDDLADGDTVEVVRERSEPPAAPAGAAPEAAAEAQPAPADAETSRAEPDDAETDGSSDG
jgi:RND family efflux transporter MFP subunit